MVKWPGWMWFFMVASEWGSGWWGHPPLSGPRGGRTKNVAFIVQNAIIKRRNDGLLLLASEPPVLRGRGIFRCSPVCSYRS
jgi:hypothetical protein